MSAFLFTLTKNNCVNLNNNRKISFLEMDKLAKYKEPTPEEKAEIDQSIRESKRSIGIRRLVTLTRSGIMSGRSITEIASDPAISPLREEYPKLFEMLCDPRCSPAMLTAMLTQLEAVENGTKSAHDASVFVGTALVNSYVRPRLGMEQATLPNSVEQSGHSSKN